MSLNKISLNNRLLAQLFRGSLLETTLPQRHTNEPGQPSVGPAAAPAPTHVTSLVQNAPVTEVAAPAALTRTPAPASTTSMAYGNTPFLGGNGKGILILVSTDAYPYLPDTELDFLTTILGACRLSIADVAIVNLHHHPQPYTELLRQFNSKQVLLMGITPQQIDLPFHFPHFQLQQFDQRTYLSALPLGSIAQSRDLKMQLWGCLKNLFGI